MRGYVSKTSACGVILALGIALCPSVAVAERAPRHAAAPSSLATLSPISQTLLRSQPATSMVKAQSGTAADADPKSFFSTAKGRLALVLVGATIGYAFYSAVHDREPVKSPVR